MISRRRMLLAAAAALPAGRITRRGSGFQTAGDGSTGAIRGRLEFGTLRFVARFMNGSDEYTKLKAQTAGTAVVHLQFDTNNSLDLTWQQIA